MALKLLAKAGSTANKDRLYPTQKGALDRIEAAFKKIADVKFRTICSAGIRFTLFLKNDIKLKYFFDPAKASEQIQSEFYNLLASQESKIGDQVMIHMCTMIETFVVLNLGKTGEQLVLTIDVNL